MRRREIKLVVKSLGSTEELQLKLIFLSAGEESGIPSVAVKCVDIRRNTSGEGDFLDRNWRWGTKVWGANRIRYPGSPHCKRWILGVGDDFIICAESKRNKYPTWGVRPQGWNSKELTGARTSSGVCGLIRSNANNLTRAWHIQEYIRDYIALRRLYTGGAWLSSARVVRCWVKSRNERNPYF